MGTKRTTFLKLLDAMALLGFIAAFSPLVIPENTMAPMLLGIPYTMWMGLLVSFFFVFLAYLVSLIHKEENNAD